MPLNVKFTKQNMELPRPPQALLPAGLVSGQGCWAAGHIVRCITGGGMLPGNKALRPDFSQKDVCFNETRLVIKYQGKKGASLSLWRCLPPTPGRPHPGREPPTM